MLGFNERAVGALTDASGRVIAIVSSATAAGLVEQSEALCERYGCKDNGLGAAIEIAKEYAPDASPRKNKDPEPVGTELSNLIPDWAIQFKEGCGCKDFAKKMDRWGVAGCIERSDQIVAHLLSQEEHLLPMLRMVPAAMKRMAAKRLLNRAISNAAKKASPHHEA